jgi:hypothetical protein
MASPGSDNEMDDGSSTYSGKPDGRCERLIDDMMGNWPIDMNTLRNICQNTVETPEEKGGMINAIWIGIAFLADHPELHNSEVGLDTSNRIRHEWKHLYRGGQDGVAGRGFKELRRLFAQLCLYLAQLMEYLVSRGDSVPNAKDRILRNKDAQNSYSTVQEYAKVDA